MIEPWFLQTPRFRGQRSSGALCTSVLAVLCERLAVELQMLDLIETLKHRRSTRNFACDFVDMHITYWKGTRQRCIHRNILTYCYDNSGVYIKLCCRQSTLPVEYMDVHLFTYPPRYNTYLTNTQPSSTGNIIGIVAYLVNQASLDSIHSSDQVRLDQPKTAYTVRSTCRYTYAQATPQLYRIAVGVWTVHFKCCSRLKLHIS